MYDRALVHAAWRKMYPWIYVPRCRFRDCLTSLCNGTKWNAVRLPSRIKQVYMYFWYNVILTFIKIWDIKQMTSKSCTCPPLNTQTHAISGLPTKACILSELTGILIVYDALSAQPQAKYWPSPESRGLKLISCMCVKCSLVARQLPAGFNLHARPRGGKINNRKNLKGHICCV